MPSYRSLTKKFTVYKYREDLGFRVAICGLCANSGIIDTTKLWDVKECGGIKTYCICPNGRVTERLFKKQREKPYY